MCNKVKILDCENYDSAIESLSNIFDLDIEILKKPLIEIDFLELWEDKFQHQMTFSEFIYNYYTKNFCVDDKIDKVCWFHLSRTLDAEKFKKGILPLGQIKEELFIDMYDLVSDNIPLDIWKGIIKDGAGGNNHYLYTERTKNPFHYGPYAMLIKEVAFKPKEIGNHDYLSIPEIVEDIAIGLNSSYGINFTERYLASSYPIIVKFILDFSDSNFDTTKSLIEATLNYVYVKNKNEELSCLCNTSYDGRNKSISKHNILYIDKYDNNLKNIEKIIMRTY